MMRICRGRKRSNI